MCPTQWGTEQHLHVSRWATCLREVTVQSHPSLPVMSECPLSQPIVDKHPALAVQLPSHL